MGVFGAVFGCRGDAGFSSPLLGASSGAGGFMLACISGCRGVIGFKVGTWPCPVREKVRPAWPDVCVSAKKFALRAQNGSKSAFCGVLGEFYRGKADGGGVLGEFFRGKADGGGVLGCDSGAGSLRIPPRITSGPPHMRSWLLPGRARASVTPAEDSGRRHRARPPQPRRRSSGRRPWRPRGP